jgi:hypothetical protein
MGQSLNKYISAYDLKGRFESKPDSLVQTECEATFGHKQPLR